jgi:hypothetical protein
MIHFLADTISRTYITTTEANLGIALLSAIGIMVGWIVRQQIRWMARIEEKINKQEIAIAVMNATLNSRTAVVTAIKQGESSGLRSEIPT